MFFNKVKVNNNDTATINCYEKDIEDIKQDIDGLSKITENQLRCLMASDTMIRTLNEYTDFLADELEATKQVAFDCDIMLAQNIGETYIECKKIEEKLNKKIKKNFLINFIITGGMGILICVATIAGMYM